MLFTDIKLPGEIMRGIERMGFETMTEIQEKAIEPMLQGKDIIAKAPTGTGKTCAFGIPLLVDLNRESKKPQALILAPTRELAQQINEDLQDLSHYMPGVNTVCLYGGENIQKQIDSLRKSPQIVVATPGRLMDHLNRRTLNLTTVTKVVLDEADEMLDMGFYKDVRKILDGLKNRKQLGMFSATISREVMDIGWLYQRDPVEITVEPIESSQPRIKQYSLLTTGRNKLADLAHIVVQNSYKRVMVFCNTKYTTGMLANQLARLNFNVDCLHGDLSQKERNKIMSDFRKGNIGILISTDVAARGIDVEDVDAVINYDVPASNEYYTHRIGRTGRALKEGAAYILYMPDEEKRMKDLVRLTQNTVIPIKIDGEGKIHELE